MFFNTSGGAYQIEGNQEKCSYTFPKGSSVCLNGVTIPLEEVKVKFALGNYGMDAKNKVHFAQALKSIVSKNSHVYHSSATLRGYTRGPTDDELIRNNMPSTTKVKEIKQLMILKKRKSNMLNENQLNAISFVETLINDINQNDHKQIAKEIRDFLDSTPYFPKNISFIYSDVVKKVREIHDSHIKLCFLDDKSCTITIDNSTSVCLMYEDKKREDIKQRFGIDLHTCIEDHDKNNIKVIRCFDEKNLEKVITLQSPFSPNDVFMELFYSKLKSTIEALGFKVKGININYHKHNQKDVPVCTFYAFQHMLNAITHSEPKSQFIETPWQRGARMKAELAVLSYLLTGKKEIPNTTLQEKLDEHLDNEKIEWVEHYPQFSNTCEQIDTVLKALSYEELKQLFFGSDNEKRIIMSSTFYKFFLEKNLSFNELKSLYFLSDVDEFNIPVTEKELIKQAMLKQLSKEEGIETPDFNTEQEPMRLSVIEAEKTIFEANSFLEKFSNKIGFFTTNTVINKLATEHSEYSNTLK